MSAKFRLKPSIDRDLANLLYLAWEKGRVVCQKPLRQPIRITACLGCDLSSVWNLCSCSSGPHSTPKAVSGGTAKFQLFSQVFNLSIITIILFITLSKRFFACSGKDIQSRKSLIAIFVLLRPAVCFGSCLSRTVQFLSNEHQLIMVYPLIPNGDKFLVHFLLKWVI